MRATRAVLATAVMAAGTLTAVAAAQPSAATQRVVIEANATLTTFAFRSLKAGALKKDSGTVVWGTPTERVVIRAGQRVEIDDVSASFAGGKGTFAARFRIEWTNAGHGYVIGSSRWTVVRGTGAYAHVNGGGHGASVWPPAGEVRWRVEGYLGS